MKVRIGVTSLFCAGIVALTASALFYIERNYEESEDIIKNCFEAADDEVRITFLGWGKVQCEK